MRPYFKKDYCETIGIFLSPAGQDVPLSPVKMLYKCVNLQLLVWHFDRKGNGCNVFNSSGLNFTVKMKLVPQIMVAFSYQI